MALKVKCKCGKAFGAPDKYAGKRVKCPGCGESVTIPATGASPPKAKAIKATCACGKSVTVKAELAGKRIKCPACSQPITIPAAASAGSARPKKHSASAATKQNVGGSIGDLLDEVDLSETSTGQRCPECRSDMGPDDILCIQCGYRVDRGAKMETKKVVKPESLSLKAGVPPKSKTEAIPAAVSDLAKALRFLGYLNLVLGVIAIVGWAAIFAMGSMSSTAQVDPLAGAVSGFFGIVIVLSAIYMAAVVWGLFFAAKQVTAGKNLGRILSIVIAVLFLPGVPIGTAIGVYLLVKSLSQDVSAYCVK